MELDQPTTIQKSDTWTESFQDLRSWCHPDQDELNTPQITISVQDEFNFSPDGQVINCDWGYVQSPVEINDLLLASPNNVIMDEENNNYTVVDIQGNFATFSEGDDNKSTIGKAVDYNSPLLMMVPGSSALKTKSHDVLLSQAGQLDTPPPKPEESLILGGGFFDNNKLNSSQTSTSAARHGSGGKLIFKMEQKDPEEFKVPVREATLLPALSMQQPQFHLQPRRTLQGKPSRPKLKPLNIPQQPVASNSSSLATPDVLKPLTDISTSGFNLLRYVCGGGEDPRAQSNPGKEGIVSLQDHDYVEPVTDENILIKCEPLSPTSANIVPSLGTAGNRKRSHSITREEDEDYYDSDPTEGGSLIDGDSGSDEWVPGVEKRPPTGRGRRSRKTSSGGDSLEGPDRYRALRDRNNEASRRSRQNRKQRDMEIRRHKAELEKRNAVLRVKADRMEALVKEMRATLLQSIKNSRNKSLNS